jgi:hypothetical protein
LGLEKEERVDISLTGESAFRSMGGYVLDSLGVMDGGDV